MKLLGQFDSPFVRRVGIAMRLYGFPFEHLPWSVFADAERLAQLNPLRRVPVLVLDDGSVLIESSVILDALDEMAADLGKTRLLPERGLARRQHLKICALATGVGDKAVSLVYERVLASGTKAGWLERCSKQIFDTLGVLEHELQQANRSHPYFFGTTMGHADIAVCAVLRFLREAHPDLWEKLEAPALRTLSAQSEALPVFRELQQPFHVAST